MNDDIKKIADYYRIKAQTIKTIEEMSELSKCLCKIFCVNIDKKLQLLEDIKEEIADVTLMLEQLKYIFSFRDEDINNIIEKKVQRTLERIELEKKNSIVWN